MDEGTNVISREMISIWAVRPVLIDLAEGPKSRKMSKDFRGGGRQRTWMKDFDEGRRRRTWTKVFCGGFGGGLGRKTSTKKRQRRV